MNLPQEPPRSQADESDALADTDRGRQLREWHVARVLRPVDVMPAAVVAAELAGLVMDWDAEADRHCLDDDTLVNAVVEAMARYGESNRRLPRCCEVLARLFGEVPWFWKNEDERNPFCGRVDRDEWGRQARDARADAERLRVATDEAWRVLGDAAARVRREEAARLVPLDLDAVEPVPCLAEGLLAGGQPAVIAGPYKCGKTQLAVELACCLASGRSFLGCPVPRPVRVALFSGESGGTTLAGYCRDAGRPDGLGVYPRLPADPADLAGELARRPAGVVILDPLYLLLDGSQTTNLIATARQLDAWTRACATAGATAVFVHHFVESVRPGKRPALEDITVAGTKQFFRQWLVMNRRVPFRPDGPDELWLNAGGSAGHAVELEVDHTREPWTWTARPASRRDDAGGEARGRRARTRQTSPDDKILRVLPPEGMRTTKLREAAGLNGGNYPPAIKGLLEAGRITRGPDGLILPGAGEP